MSTHDSSQLQSLAKANLSLGYFALAVAVVLASAAPATSHETSIYAGTPVEVWVALGLALLAGTVGAFFVPWWRLRVLSLGLGGLAVMAFWCLPILRGYRYVSMADGLTHLGWARDVAGGTLQPVELFYPGLHTVSALVASLTGFGIPRSVLLAVAAFALLFVLFVTLTVRRLTASALGTAIGAATAFLLLPINVITIQPTAHPISQTAFYFALVLFLFVGYLTAGDERRGLLAPWRAAATGIGTVLLLVLLSLVLFHPQGAVVVLILFGTISAVQFLGRRLGSARLGAGRPLYAPTAFLAAWFGFWIGSAHPELLGQADRILARIVAFFTGAGGEAGQIVARRGTSIRQVGASLPEVFLRLFFIETIFALLTAGFVVAVMLGRLDADPEMETVTRFLGYGLLVFVPWTFLQFVGPISGLVFRYLGFLMVIGSVLGACAIYYLLRRAGGAPAGGRLPANGRRPGSTDGGQAGGGPAIARVALVVLFVPLLIASLGTAYPSTFLYHPSGHVTDAQLDGYDTVFTYQDDALEVADVGLGSDRYRHAVEGTTGNIGTASPGPGTEYDHDLPGFLRDTGGDDGVYLVVTEFDRSTQADAYRGIRFDRSDFEQLSTDTEVNRVTSNGEVELYQYDPDDEDSEAAARGVR